MKTTKELLDDIITKNYNEYLSVAKKYKSIDSPQDILQECLCIIYEMPEEKQLKIISYIDYYILQMIKISSLSATSSYQQKYNKILIDKNIDSYNYLIECPIEEYTEPLEYFDDEVITKELIMSYVNRRIKKVPNEIIVNNILTIIKTTLKDKCNWYEETVFMQYIITKKPFYIIGKETGIPASSLFETYKRVKKILIENLYL